MTEIDQCKNLGKCINFYYKITVIDPFTQILGVNESISVISWSQLSWLESQLATLHLTLSKYKLKWQSADFSRAFGSSVIIWNIIGVKFAARCQIEDNTLSDIGNQDLSWLIENCNDKKFRLWHWQFGRDFDCIHVTFLIS